LVTEHSNQQFASFAVAAQASKQNASIIGSIAETRSLVTDYRNTVNGLWNSRLLNL